jgi:hypothetical protein
VSVTEIPTLPLEAEELSVGAVQFVEAIVALFCLLIVIAGWVVLYLLHLALGKISIFGFHPFDFFYNLATDALRSTFGYLEARCTAFAHWLWALVMTVWRPLYVILAVLYGLTTQLVGVSQGSQKGIADANAKEQTDINTLDGIIAAESTSLQNQINGLTGALNGYEAGAALDLQSKLSQLQASINTEIQGQVGNLTNAINTVDQSLNTDIQKAFGSLSTALSQQIGGLNTTLNNDVASIDTAINTVQQSIPTVANQVVAQATPGIITQVETQLAPTLSKITTEITTCLDPLCETVTPNAKQLGDLGKLLKDLEGIFATGALMALLVAAVEDPKQTARVIVDTTGWISTTALDLVDVVSAAASVNL